MSHQPISGPDGATSWCDVCQMYCGGTTSDGVAIQCGCHSGKTAELPIVPPVHPPEAVALPANGTSAGQTHVTVTEVAAAPAGAVKADVVPPKGDDPDEADEGA